ncbi:adenylate/guanylate cyclase domain-containing protein [Ruegeria arenilitoris]|uniref:adenylate/guanylate cyclase domain-containing protein n=1 Tax=Ruegeria arenilitoris TaxID=1173585 RepID=UPI00147EA544|nr:adenylate/guanylate cyclase domain-containing protein [Ruegeria arenilitoris]
MEKADEYFHRTGEIVETGREVVGLYEAGQREAARLLFDTALIRALRALDRDTVKLTFQSRVSMNSLVKSNEAAFLRSQKVVGFASVFAVFIALVLGYTTSSSIVRPVGSIRTALQEVTEGDFSARARVSNGDELGELAERVNSTTEQLGEWNHTLESKVAEQVEIISRTNRLRRFLPKPVADQIIASGDDTLLLARHRAEIVVLFADLRGFTAFAETNEAEVVTDALNAFHKYVGPLIESYEGTLERFLGDGLVVLFNAPIKCSDPETRAVKLAMDIQHGFRSAMERFQSPVRRLGLGVGIAKGIASLGQIGFEGRLDYAAIGTVSNVASRLCGLALDTEVLASNDVADEVRGEFSFLE